MYDLIGWIWWGGMAVILFVKLYREHKGLAKRSDDGIEGILICCLLIVVFGMVIFMRFTT